MLEKIVREELQFHNYAEWLERQQKILRQVCRIEVDGRPAGTGFLVGRSSVVTNYHVIVDGNDQPHVGARITCRFDCTGHDNGEECRLTPGGIVASSPWSPHDLSLDPRPDPAEDELDFALLELAEPAGNARGFVQLAADPPAFPPQTPLFIVQHPAGGPLQVAFDTQAVIGVNHNRTRIRYRTNTLRGSSGSPCFDANWRVVALHHSGDPGLHHKGNASATTTKVSRSTVFMPISKTWACSPPCREHRSRIMEPCDQGTWP